MDETTNVVTTPQETVVTEVAEQSTQQATNTTTEQSTQQTTEKQSFKIKHLHEEKEISFDEAPTYIQKGMDYDRVKGKYEESKPVLSFVEKLAQQNGLTVPEYLKAVEEHERRQEIESLAQQKNVDPELAEELYLLRQERKERETSKQQQEREEREKQEYLEFLNEFPEITKPDDVPAEVWDIKRKNPNLSITDAYIRHERQQLKAKLAAQEINKANAASATGSVTGNGNASGGDFITPETFEANKSDQSWVNKNFSKIMESRRKW